MCRLLGPSVSSALTNGWNRSPSPRVLLLLCSIKARLSLAGSLASAFLKAALSCSGLQPRCNVRQIA